MSLLSHLNPDLSDLVPYQPGKPIEEVAREHGLNPDDIVKLASNENPLGPSPKAMRAMKATAAEMNLYPDGGAWILRHKLAAHMKVEPGQIIFGNGSNEILEFIAHAFLRKGTSAVMSAHAFVIYKLLAKMQGADVIEFPARGLGHDLRAISRGIPQNARVVFICNPNNPTSSMLFQNEIDSFMKNIPDDVLVVFDEAYAEIALRKMPDTIKYINERPNVIVLRTFSKCYGLAGLRVGYGLANKELISALERVRQPFNLNRMAQAAAAAALDDAAFLRRTRRVFKQAAAILVKFCESMNLEYETPHANFILIKVGDGAKVFKELQERGVIVRPMGGMYKLPEWIRVSFGTEAENNKFISALSEIL
jgi:histidinol-phosphate aminotransferase